MMKKISLSLSIALTFASASTWALPAPQYLSIEGFKHCLKTRAVDTYEQWCMPKAKPRACKAAAWKALKNLPPQEKVPSCESAVRH